MYKVLEPLSFRVYTLEAGDICVEGYKLADDREVMYLNGKWVDFKDREYTPVTIERIIGFNQKNSLSKVDIKILSSTPEGKAYVEYNKRIGGDILGLEVPNGYPPPVQEYLDKGHTLEELYRECIEAGVSWEERFSWYYRDNNDIVI